MADLGPPLSVTLTHQQIREIWARIVEIKTHFAGCCAFMMDKCQHLAEYNQLYKFLILAGAPEAKMPFTPEEFEAWMDSRSPARDRRPHSRACGIKWHEHGSECTPDCPTCGGGKAEP